MYADDLILLSSSVSGLQAMLNTCDLYGKSHALLFNVKKTSCDVVGRHRHVDALFFLYDQVFPLTDKFKYFRCAL